MQNYANNRDSPIRKTSPRPRRRLWNTLHVKEGGMMPSLLHIRTDHAWDESAQTYCVTLERLKRGHRQPHVATHSNEDLQTVQRIQQAHGHIHLWHCNKPKHNATIWQGNVEPRYWLRWEGHGRWKSCFFFGNKQHAHNLRMNHAFKSDDTSSQPPYKYHENISRFEASIMLWRPIFKLVNPTHDHKTSISKIFRKPV